MLVDDEARAVMLGAGLEPIAPYPGVDAPWPCRHIRCGREVAPSYSNTKKGQRGCPPCAAEDVALKLRMPEETAVSVMRAVALEPLEPYPGFNRPWRARHLVCGRVVSPTFGNARRSVGVCRYCYSSFPFDGVAVLYLVGNDRALKVGIAGPGSDRLRQHRRWGWSTCWTLDLPTGDEAWRLEHAVVDWWRGELGSPPAYGRGEMPQGGETETVASSVVSPDDVLLYVLSLRE